MKVYSVYAKGSKGKFEHIGDDYRVDVLEAACAELRRQGYQVRLSSIVVTFD